MPQGGSWNILDDVAVLPGYEEIYGSSCSREQLITIVKRYSINDWLCNLARLACVLTPGG